MKKKYQFGWRQEIEKITLMLSIASMVILIILYYVFRMNEFVQNLIVDLFSVALLFTLSQIFLGNLNSIRSREETDLLAGRMFELMTSHSERLKRIVDSGIVDTHDILPFPEIKYKISHAKKRIRVLHTFIDDPRQYKDSFLSATKNNKCNIQILLLNPDSPYAKQRSSDVWPHDELNSPDEEYVSKQIRYAISVLRNMTSIGELKNVEVRLYDCLPSIAMYIIDDQVVFGFFLLGTKTDSASQITVSGDSHLGRDMLDEFEVRWNKSSTIIKS